jgi:HAD superfamily hydrolase (TIGR01509 family)
VTPDDEGRLAELLAGTGPLLLDFDGPVCSIFAGHPAPQVAGELRHVLTVRGVPIVDTIATEPDPLEVLRWTGQLGDVELTRAVEDTLCAAELRAVQSAEPTPYAREVIVSAREVGKPVAVVSNNSAGAVRAYLELHRLAAHVAVVIGRAYAQPELMKPNPEPIRRVVSALGVEPEDCVLLGDSLADIAGGQAAKVKVVAYANRPAKEEPFRTAKPDAVVTGMSEVCTCLGHLKQQG